MRLFGLTQIDYAISPFSGSQRRVSGGRRGTLPWGDRALSQFTGKRMGDEKAGINTKSLEVGVTASRRRR